MQGVEFVVRVQSVFRVRYACRENADVMIWLSIGADVILERPTREWEGKINALAPRTGYLIGRLGAFDGYRLIHGRTGHEKISIVSEAVRKRALPTVQEMPNFIGGPGRTRTCNQTV